MAQGNFTTHTTVYTPAVMDEIYQRIGKGETLTSICRDEHLPSFHTIQHWLADGKIPNIQANIAQARERGYDSLAEQSLLVAKGVENYSTGDINRDKLVVETTLKLLAKWSKKYADKQQVEISGKDGEPLSLRLIAAQQRLLKDITPQTKVIEHQATIAPDDII